MGTFTNNVFGQRKYIYKIVILNNILCVQRLGHHVLLVDVKAKRYVSYSARHQQQPSSSCPVVAEV
jgi:hypothetical protein